MPNLVLINIAKREVVEPMDDGYGWKMREYLLNDMPLDIIWLFAVLVDSQPAPEPPAVQSGPARVPVGHWAGDQYPTAEPTDSLIEFADEHFAHMCLPGYRQAAGYHWEGANDTLFPADRVWVLRSLTKGRYARADALLDPEDRCEPALADRHGSGLGDLL
ncbi:hypothetical protein FB451DRAFT_1395094 [Mycena latifolia]|nr:hypothetical protein FB451DRAFT_1395094 [Mycena latifolia]